MLKPRNIIQAAEADLRRAHKNQERAEHNDHHYEQYAFHRQHVRKSRDACELIRLALMNPTVADNTTKKNTRMIYGNARLLIEALRDDVGGP